MIQRRPPHCFFMLCHLQLDFDFRQVLRPYDSIRPYRLEMASKLKTSRGGTKEASWFNKCVFKFIRYNIFQVHQLWHFSLQASPCTSFGATSSQMPSPRIAVADWKPFCWILWSFRRSELAKSSAWWTAPPRTQVIDIAWQTELLASGVLEGHPATEVANRLENLCGSAFSSAVVWFCQSDILDLILWNWLMQGYAGCGFWSHHRIILCFGVAIWDSKLKVLGSVALHQV